MMYIIYDLSGKIIKSISCPPEMIETQLLSSNYYIEGGRVDDSRFYIQNQQVVPRPTFSESITGTTISNLPIPTTIVIDDTPYTIDDGSAELSFSLLGTYRVRLYSFPYQDKEVEVTQV